MSDEPVSDDRLKPYNLHLPVALMDAVKAEAERAGTSMRFFVAEALRSRLESPVSDMTAAATGDETLWRDRAESALALVGQLDVEIAELRIALDKARAEASEARQLVKQPGKSDPAARFGMETSRYRIRGLE